MSAVPASLAVEEPTSNCDESTGQSIDADAVKVFNYVVPTKQANAPDLVKVWEASEAYQEYLGFIISIGDSIAGRRITEEVDVSDSCRKVIDLLVTLRGYVDSVPPQDIKVRYGNPAYRDWFDLLAANAEHLIGDLLPDILKPARIELAPYLVDSFGNRTRIDYGTGHEKTFVMFVCALFKIGLLTETDRTAVGLKVFSAYFDLARYLQTVYRMEPAGSMGVWNLDDFQFVAFIFGAAQLTQGSRLKPKSISDSEMAEMLKKDYHIFACLTYIHHVKTGPFHEHSNQLWNISGVPQWSKVYSGLMKMYKAEVLSKFPVIQHSLFGSIFTLEQAKQVCHLPSGGVSQVPGIDDRVTGVPGMSGPFHPGPGYVPGSRLPTLGTRFPLGSLAPMGGSGIPEASELDTAFPMASETTRFPMASEITTRFPMASENTPRFPMASETTTRFPMASETTTRFPMVSETTTRFPMASEFPPKQL